MARTALSVTQLANTGTDLATDLTAANVDGHSVANDGNMFIVVENLAVGSINVTVVTPYTIEGLALPDVVVAVAQNEIKIIGPFPPKYFNQSGGVVHVDFSAVTTVNCAAYKIR